MRELERDLPPSLNAARPGAEADHGLEADHLRIAVVGAGRLGAALAPALTAAGHRVTGPLRRGEQTGEVDVVLLCVPDSEIAGAAGVVQPGPLVGHCSGATGLDVLAPHEGFSLHPLMTVTREHTELRGAGAAVAANSPRAAALAERLAADLGLEPVEVDDADRAAYHAAASLASNFLVTLEAAAERLAATAGVPRETLVPLVRQTVENWAALGPERALTGPIARGDEATVARQRAALAERTPELLELFDALAAATRALASSGAPA